MLTKNILFKNFQNKKRLQIIENIFLDIKKKFYKKSDPFLNSLTNLYKNSFSKNNLKNLKKYKEYNVIGMGGSVLGAKAIYYFLEDYMKKKFYFTDNIKIKKIPNTKKNLNLIISKSGNTLETIVNFNTLQRNNNSVFLTENTNNYLRNIATKIESEIFEHKNFIGGRYSVLSETGMLPASLMGLDVKKFKSLNYLIKNKRYVEQLISNVSSILSLYKNKKTNSIILNYDEKSHDLFLWYQQLVAESLGKNSKGILPIVSSMPKDNHSLMQLYLDGKKNNFFTFFMVNEKSSNEINKNFLSKEYTYLCKKKSFDILKAQFAATQNIFRKKKIPFRTFIVKKRNEKVLGELFNFFILETIMLGKAMNINPFNQPHVELIKKETYKILKTNLQR